MGAAASTLQAVRVAPWLAGSTVSVTNASSSATNLTAFAGQGVLMSCDVPFHILWGPSTVSAAQTTDLMVPANTLIRVDIPDIATALGYFRVIREGSTSGTLTYAVIQS